MLRQILLLVAALLPRVAMADEAVETLPFTSPWEMNYDEDSCHLARRFGEGDAQVTAVFTRYQPEDRFELRLHGKRFARFAGAMVDVSTDFGADGTDFRGDAYMGLLGDMPVILIPSRFLVEWAGRVPPPITPQQEAGVRNVTIRAGRSPPFMLALGSMAQPMAAMRACTNDLVRSWGLDPVEQAALSRKPTPTGNPGSWVTTSDYPSDALRTGHLGVVRFRLMIEPDGGIGECVVQAQTSPTDFAELTCRLLRSRARFLPALSVDGQPVRSYYVSTVRFMLP